MLSSHLEPGVRVLAVERKPIDVTDGVKGDKVLVDVKYDRPVKGLPTAFFVKFNVAPEDLPGRAGPAGRRLQRSTQDSDPG